MIGTIAILLSCLYLTTSILGFLVLRPPFVGFVLGLLRTAILLSVFGVVSLSLGLGLWFNRNWAKRGWLLFSIVLVAFHSLWLIKNIPLGISWDDYLEVGLILGVAASSWTLLRNTTKLQANEEKK